MTDTMPAPLSRSLLEGSGARPLQPGGPTKADLWLVPVAGGQAVIKDFAAKSAPVRLWGRVQIRREASFYRLLSGVEGLPRFLGRIDAWALALEYVEGKSLKRCRRRPQRGDYFRRLAATLDELHRRGIIHNDLRAADNALVARGSDRVVLLDLGGALRLPPGTMRHRLLFTRLARVDRAALLKWKRLLLPEEMSAQELAFLRRFRRWRRLWIFNPKGAGWLGRRPS